ncbi:MAG: thioesterase [Actinobacteria bacterium]|nr:thioesterase [Actinomycetota bacterium]MCL6104990.1 thioesterase [Actinomycetota bacterium]
MPTLSLHIGSTAQATLEVSQKDTAIALGSGDTPVLGTPRLIALCEEATFLATQKQLKAGWTTVALRVQFDHLAPVEVGKTVTAEALLEKVSGRRLTFVVRVKDSASVIGGGKIVRVLVNTQHFLEKAKTH